MILRDLGPPDGTWEWLARTSSALPDSNSCPSVRRFLLLGAWAGFNLCSPLWRHTSFNNAAGGGQHPSNHFSCQRKNILAEGEQPWRVIWDRRMSRPWCLQSTNISNLPQGILSIGNWECPARKKAQIFRNLFSFHFGVKLWTSPSQHRKLQINFV